MKSQITYVKSDRLTITGAGEDAVAIDLGLGIEEAARVLRIDLGLEISGAWGEGDLPQIEGVVSFDPEDLVVAHEDDEQFCYAIHGCFCLTTGGHVRTANHSFDYSGINLITTRNLALLAKGTVANTAVVCRVFYEKYVPAAADLIQLIATRR